MITNAKVHGPVSNSDYHMRQDVNRGDPKFVMSRSELKDFATCPARWIAGYKLEKSAEMSWGDKLDCLLFTPEKFSARFVVTPKTYMAPASKRKDAPLIEKKWNARANPCAEWLEAHVPEGAETLSHEESEELRQAVSVIRCDPEIKELLACSRFQVLATATYVDPATKIAVPVKALIDIEPDQSSRFGKALADLKSCASAHPNVFEDDVAKYWYDSQGAFYCDVYTAAGQDRCDFYHVLSESFKPFQIGKRFLTPEYMDIGRQKYESAFKLYCQCLDSGVWPNYEQNALPSKVRIDGQWLATEPGKRALAYL